MASSSEISKAVDIISNLPEIMRERILTYLPIKEAGRTSVLSSAWRHTWTSIPILQIDDSDCCTGLGIVELVDTILILHRGPIHEFELTTNKECSTALDRWIGNLSKNGIEKFELYLNNDLNYKIPSSFFDSNTLTSICLSHCYVKLPTRFKGFKLLRNLHLSYVHISGDCMDKLVSGSPMLENFITLHLHAPESLTHQDVDKGNVLGKFQEISPNLRKAVFCLRFEVEEDNSFLLSLLMNAPKLETLSIWKISDGVWGNHHFKFWDSINESEFSFERLKNVQIYKFEAKPNTLAFVKFLLRSAPNLLKFSLRHKGSFDEQSRNYYPANCFRELLMFRRASKHAQIDI